jgi:hypothetical protein
VTLRGGVLGGKDTSVDWTTLEALPISWVRLRSGLICKLSIESEDNSHNLIALEHSTSISVVPLPPSVVALPPTVAPLPPSVAPLPPSVVPLPPLPPSGAATLVILNKIL